MKELKRKALACCTAAAVLGGTAMAQVSPSPTAPVRPADTDTDSTAMRAEVGKSHQFLRSKDLVGAAVKDAQGEKVGDINEIYINPQTGVVLAAIDITGSRDALVPLQALNVGPPKGLLRNVEVTFNKRKADLEAGPMISSSEWHKLDDASFTRSIYSHYQLEMPRAMGGASSPGGALTGKDTDKPGSDYKHRD